MTPLLKPILRATITTGALLLIPTSTVGQANPPPQSNSRICQQGVTLETIGLVGVRAEYGRLLEITGRADVGPGMIHRWSNSPVLNACGPNPWSLHLSPAVEGPNGPQVRLLPLHVMTVVNTGYPRDRNNGALLAGRGISSAALMGVAMEWGPVSAAVAPQILYQQNASYVQAPWRSHPHQRIDLPERIGEGHYALLDLGHSYIRSDAFGLALGISNENLWMGPGIGSSIVLSATGPGFPHVFARTSGPVDVGIGLLDAEMFWGRLGESRLFDEVDENDRRLITTFAVGFEPAALPGLHMGAARLVHMNIRGGLEAGSLLAPFRGLFRVGSEALGDDSDEFASLYFRWVMPESGFEVFGEYTKYDGNADFHDLIVEPDNGRTYLLGLQKVVEAGRQWMRLYGEVANLNPALPVLHRAVGGVYRHSVIPQGHTHRGQLLGAWTGPASDYQILGGDFLEPWGTVGILAERVRRNVDIYFANPDLRKGYPLKHDVELTIGTRGTYLLHDVQIGGKVEYSHRRNRDFLPPAPHEIEQGYRVESNWSLELGVTWHPPLRQRTLFGGAAVGDAPR